MPAGTPVPLKPPRSRRLAWLVTLAGAIALLSVAGWYAARSLARASERRAALALAQKGSPEAIPVLERCLERDPDDAEVLQALIGVRIKNGARIPDVEPLVSRLVQLTPNDPEALRIQAESLHRLGRYPEALAVLTRLVELTPGNDQERAKLAALSLIAGQFEVAAREYRQLLAGSSTVPQHELLTGLARAEWELGNVPEATRLVEKALAAAPDYSNALMLRGSMHTRAGEDEAAVAIFRRVRASSREEAQAAFYQLGLALERLGRTEEAKKAFADFNSAQLPHRP